MRRADRFPAALALIGALVSDQAFKLWMLNGFDIAARGRVALVPFLDLVMVWNEGISFGLFSQDSLAGALVLGAIKLGIVAFLAVWMWRAQSRLAVISLALMIGGALGNLVDRVLYGAVADFFLFHVGQFEWYVFNLADVWIVVGFALIVYDGFASRHDPATGAS